MKRRLRVPNAVGAIVLFALVVYVPWWFVTHTGSAGELNPRSPFRILFPVLGNTAVHATAYTWARQGDTIVLDYDVDLEAGYFLLTVGKTRLRSLLRDEQRRSLRTSASGQLRYTVRHNGLHTIRAGCYSVWSGKVRVRWSVSRTAADAR